MALMPKRKRPGRKNALKKTAVREVQSTSVEAATLTSLSDVPYHVRRATRLLGNDVLNTAAVVPSQLVEMSFEKEAGSADLVRITLDNNDEVLRPTQTRGTSRPRPSGTWITAFVEIAGNPGASARIRVGHATPDAIEIRIPPGRSQNAGTKPLLVQEEA
jgi:hypothetical protein